MNQNTKKLIVTALTIITAVFGVATVISSFLILGSGIIASIIPSYIVEDTSWLWLYFLSPLFTVTAIISAVSFKGAMHKTREIILALITSILTFSSVLLIPLFVKSSVVLNITMPVSSLLICACTVTVIATEIENLKKMKTYAE